MSMGILDFYCEKYFKRFGVLPIRIEKTDRFRANGNEITLKEIERAIYPNLYKPMTESVKARLRDASLLRDKIAERRKALELEKEKSECLIPESSLKV